MKKIILSTIAIATVVAIAGVGSYALWSDQEKSTDNSITAGSLDLKIFDGENWVDDNDFSGVAVAVEDAYPGKTGGPVTVGVKNAGTVSGTLKLKLENVLDREISLEEPEKDVNDNWDTDGAGGGTGELCPEVTVDIAYGGQTIATNARLDGPWLASGITLDDDMVAEEEGAIVVTYKVKSSAGNEIMTDKCEFDVVLDLEQNQSTQSGT